MSDNSSSARAFAPRLRKAAMPEAKAYVEFSTTTFQNRDGEIPAKYRELIAIAVALTTQCEMCLESHVAAAAAAGANEQEIAETTFIAGAIRAGGAYTHGMKALRIFDEIHRSK